MLAPRAQGLARRARRPAEAGRSMIQPRPGLPAPDGGPARQSHARRARAGPGSSPAFPRLPPGRSRRNSPSHLPPVAARWPTSRAGTTRVLFRTRTSRGSNSSGSSAKVRCSQHPCRRSTTINRERSRGSIGCCAIKSSGRSKSNSEASTSLDTSIETGLSRRESTRRAIERDNLRTILVEVDPRPEMRRSFPSDATTISSSVVTVMELLPGESKPAPSAPLPRYDSGPTGLLLCRDLIFTTKVKGTAAELGYRMLVASDESLAKSLIETYRPRVVFVDLTAGEHGRAGCLERLPEARRSRCLVCGLWPPRRGGRPRRGQGRRLPCRPAPQQVRGRAARADATIFQPAGNTSG